LEEGHLRHPIIALAALALPGTALAQEEATEPLPSRHTAIHNHTDLTISKLSLRRLANGPDVVLDGSMPAEDVLDPDDAAWEEVLDEAGAPQVLETHTHLEVRWAAEECWAEFKAELSDGTAEFGSVDACNDTQLQFGSQFDHD
jgi:hypothetical protein